MINNYSDQYENYYRLNSSTLEEVCEEHTPGFLFFAAESDPSIFAGGMYPWHWHTYVQFIYVKEGEMIYQTPGEICHFHAGESGYINANVPHKLWGAPGQKTLYVEILFYPSMIGGSNNGNIMQKYVRPITENSGFEIFAFNRAMKECRKAEDLLTDIYSLFSEKQDCYELLIQAKLSLLWVMLFELSEEIRTRVSAKPSTGRLKTMLLFINEHYGEKITLEDIAEAGTCSRRECCRVFQNELHTTPFQYLAEVRVNQATHMLVNTDEAITVISENCGFSDPSHFSKVFRAKSGMTPKEFRRKASKISDPD